MTDPRDKDPAEGSRKTIENELKRQKPTGEKSNPPNEEQSRRST